MSSSPTIDTNLLVTTLRNMVTAPIPYKQVEVILQNSIVHLKMDDAFNANRCINSCSISAHVLNHMSVWPIVDVQPMDIPHTMVVGLHLEGTDLKISRTAISAGSRKFKSTTNYEELQDSYAGRPGLESPGMIVQRVCKDIAFEYDNEIIHLLEHHAHKYQDPVCRMDVLFDELSCITKYIQRPDAYVLIGSDLLSLLYPELNEEHTLDFTTGIKRLPSCHKNNWNDTPVYLMHPDLDISSNLIIGYHDSARPMSESSIVWCPLTIAVPNMVVDPATFQPLITFSTRFGYHYGAIDRAVDVEAIAFNIVEEL